MSENKCCKCGKPAEYFNALHGGNYCQDCAALDGCGGLDQIYIVKECDWCRMPLPDKCYHDGNDGYYCSLKCAILDYGFEKIENKE